MPLPIPRLDDRTYQTLVEDALRIARSTHPEWSDDSPGDPGRTLLELFAYLTDNLLYRLNRVPEKVYISLLNLMGISPRPAAAACVMLTFSHAADGARRTVEIPRGLRVLSKDGSVEFVVTRAGTLKAGADSIDLPAIHCEMVEAERVGTSSGAPGQTFVLKRGPVIARSGDGLDLVLGVEAMAGDDTMRHCTEITHEGMSYRVWSETDTFSSAPDGACAYTLDRSEGRLSFAPIGEAGAIPPAGREVRAWYRRGGGRTGNVAPMTLTAIKDGPLGLIVGNRDRAVGGADAETVEQAMRRAPDELGGSRCAVTARDYERLALQDSGIGRARAYAQAQVWSHAEPGVVEVQLVPAIATPEHARIDAALVAAHQTPMLRERVHQLLEAHRPLGVRTAVNWAHMREVSVAVRVVAGREENAEDLKRRLTRHLDALLSPLSGRAFGRVIRSSDVYEAMLSEPGTRYVDQVRFRIDDAPGDVAMLVRDPHQPRTWFAAATEGLYRSMDDGDSWARVHGAEDEVPLFCCRHPDRAGLIALGARRGDLFAVHVSRDCGRTWETNAAIFNFQAHAGAWITRAGAPVLLVAADGGLFEMTTGRGPARVEVVPAEADKGYYAVIAHTAASGVVSVAVAARDNGGVYLSAAGGVSGTYRLAGLDKKDIRALALHTHNARTHLWAAAAADAMQPGEGAFRMELMAGGGGSEEGFAAFTNGWQGGTCEALSFAGARVFAGSNRAGLLSLDTSTATPKWVACALDCGLPVRDKERLHETVAAVASATREEAFPLVLAAGPKGVFRSPDGQIFSPASLRDFSDRVPLPPHWLYCSGEHAVTVTTDEEGA